MLQIGVNSLVETIIDSAFIFIVFGTVQKLQGQTDKKNQDPIRSIKQFFNKLDSFIELDLFSK